MPCLQILLPNSSFRSLPVRTELLSSPTMSIANQTPHIDVYVIVTGVKHWNTAALGIAVVMCISTGLFFIVVILVVVASRPYDATGGDVFNREFAGGMRISNSFCNRFGNWFAIMCFGVPAYLISWGFFINLITTAKSE